MKLRVKGCYGGEFYWRVYLPGGGRERIPGDRWDRDTATRALNLLSSVSGLTRKNIRFVHV